MSESKQSVLSDAEKLRVILAKRPVENVRSCTGSYIGDFQAFIGPNDFEPWKSVDQAMMLLQGVGAEIRIYTAIYEPKIFNHTVCKIGTGRWQSDASPARAIFEAVYLACKQEGGLGK